MNRVEEVINNIMTYLQLSTMLGTSALEGKSKKRVESRRLVQIFYLGFIDGMCQLAGLSEDEQLLIEATIIKESEILKDLKISDKEFPLSDWYLFAAKGITDKIEGRVLYYGGLTARVHAAMIEGYLDHSDHAQSNSLNALSVAIEHNEYTKAKFRKAIDKAIETTSSLDRKAMNQLMTNGPKARPGASNSGCIIPIMISLSSFGLLIWILIL